LAYRLDELDPESRASLLKRHSRALAAAPPTDWPLAGNTWWRDPGIVVSLVADDVGPVCVVADRGSAFASDWVRELWLVGLRPATSPFAAFHLIARELLRRRATHLRLRLRAPISERWARVLERLGWRPITEETVSPKETTVLYGWSPELSRVWTRRGRLIGLLRPAEIPTVTTWAQTPEIYRPMGFSEPADTERLRLGIFSGGAGGHPWLQFWAIRQRGALLGIAMEHAWDYPEDGIREFDIALPGVDRPSPSLILDLWGGLAHRCFCRGGTRILANARAGASGEGFPRLYARVGAHDATDNVTQLGRGQAGRRYFTLTAPAFYASTVGRHYSPS
jgi:hypothetical protein